jgi:hypothetical protein
MLITEIGRYNRGRYGKPTGVGSRPPSRSRRLLLLAAVIGWLGLLPSADAQTFRAGTARAKISPEELGWLGGYGHRNRPAEGIAAELWTRALALEDQHGHRCVVVNADIHIFTRRLHREIVAAARALAASIRASTSSKPVGGG